MSVPSDQFEQDFADLCRDEQDVIVKLSKFQTWALMAAVQLASRHPSAATNEALKEAISIARGLQLGIASTPALAEVATMGWDRSYDFGATRQ